MNNVTQKEYQKKYRQMQRQRFAPELKKYSLMYRQKPAAKETLRCGEYRRRYNCTVEDYNSLLKSQGGKCALCGRLDNYCFVYFGIDHNHETGKIRGLLCVACNRLVGRYENKQLKDEQLVKKVEIYLAKYDVGCYNLGG